MIFSQHVWETENLSCFMMSSKVLTCHNQLGALSEYHSDSVCTHGRTKTSWLSLMRGAELKHPVETNFHCQHLVHVISLLMLTYMNIYVYICCILLFSWWRCWKSRCDHQTEKNNHENVLRIHQICSESLTEVFVTVWITVIQLQKQSRPMSDSNTQQSLLSLLSLWWTGNLCLMRL